MIFLPPCRPVRALFAGLALLVLSPAGALAQERAATLNFLGNGTGLCVYTGSEKPVFKGTLTRTDGAWREATVRAAVINFWGKTAASINLDAKADGSTLSFAGSAPSLPPGWYYLDLAVTDLDGKWTVTRQFDKRIVHPEMAQFMPPMFAVVPAPRPPEERQRSPLGVDTGVSSSYPDLLPNDLQVELAARLGVNWARDRISWEKIEPAEGTFDWDGSTEANNFYREGARVKENSENFHRHGLHVLQVFHGSPRWALPSGISSFNSAPDDLRDVYHWTKEAGTTLPDVNAWEIWNEEDIAFFCSEPPDQYAAVLKAASLGFREAPNHPSVLNGPFARDPRVGDYFATLFANGIRPYLDDYSFHTYAPTDGGVLQQVLETNLALAAKEGFGKGQIWLSESGAGYLQTVPPATREGREDVVRYLMAAYPQFILAGIRPIIWFYLRPSPEEKQWGLTDGNLEPFPAYQALAVMAHTLGEGTPLGRFSLGTATASLFQDGANEIAIVSSSGTTGGPVNLGSVPAGVHCLDVMGAPLAMPKNAAGEAVVDSSGWPFYVLGTAWKGRVTQAAKILPSMTVKQPAPSGIVVRARYPRELIAVDSGQPIMNFDFLASKWAPRGYRVAAGGSIAASVEIYNFSSQPASGKVSVNLPTGFATTTAQEDFSVEPGGRQILAFAITAVDPAPGARISFVAQYGSGAELDRSVSLWNATTHAP
jgi:hypothetical protein